MPGIWHPTNKPKRTHIDYGLSREMGQRLDRIGSDYAKLGRIVAQKCLRVVLDDTKLQEQLPYVWFGPGFDEQVWVGPRTFRRLEDLSQRLSLSVPGICIRAVHLVLEENGDLLPAQMEAFIRTPAHYRYPETLTRGNY